MNSTYQGAFYQSFANIMPQFGFGHLRLMYTEKSGRNIKPSDITVTVSVDGDLQGNVMYTMNESCAVKIASAMIGTPIESFDESAQRAISKLAYLLAENACLVLTGLEVTADISIPTLMHGTFSVDFYRDPVIHYQTNLDGAPFSIYVSLREK